MRNQLAEQHYYFPFENETEMLARSALYLASFNLYHLQKQTPAQEKPRPGLLKQEFGSCLFRWREFGQNVFHRIFMNREVHHLQFHIIFVVVVITGILRIVTTAGSGIFDQEPHAV